MSGAFVIEIDGQTAGLAIAEKRGFRFAASDRIFRKLDGRLFAHVRQAHRAAAEIWRTHAKSAASGRDDTLFGAAAPPPSNPPARQRASWGLSGDHRPTTSLSGRTPAAA